MTNQMVLVAYPTSGRQVRVRGASEPGMGVWRMVPDDGRVALEEMGGRGRVVLLIHGGGMNLEWWRPCGELLRERLRVVAVDLQGHGQSVPRGPLTYASWVDDVVFVLDQIDAESAVLIGHSFGGRVALAAAAARPARCDGVVTVDGTIVDWGGPARALLAAAEDDRAYLEAARRDPVRSFVGSRRQLETLLASMKGSERRRAILRRRFVADGPDVVRFNPTAEEALAMARLELEGRGVPLSTYDHIRCRVLSLFTRDSIASGAVWPYRQDVHDSLSARHGFDVGWISGGHNRPSEEPNELATRILDWLEPNA